MTVYIVALLVLGHLQLIELLNYCCTLSPTQGYYSTNQLTQLIY